MTKNTSELKLTTPTGIPAVQGFGSFEINTDSYSFDNAKLGVEGGASVNLPEIYSVTVDVSIFLQVENKNKEDENKSKSNGYD